MTDMQWFPGVITPEREIGRYRTSAGKTARDYAVIILAFIAFLVAVLIGIVLWAVGHWISSIVSFVIASIMALLFVIRYGTRRH